MTQSEQEGECGLKKNEVGRSLEGKVIQDLESHYKGFGFYSKMGSCQGFEQQSDMID